MVMSPTTTVFDPPEVEFTTIPSFLSSRISIRIPFATILFRYLLDTFSRFSWVMNFWVSWLSLRSILDTKLLREHLRTASIAYLLFSYNWHRDICFMLFLMYRLFI